MQARHKGKVLGFIVFIIGCVTIVWAFVPDKGAEAFWPALGGMIIGTRAVIMAITSLNPKKGIIITGFALCMISTGAATYKLANRYSKPHESIEIHTANINSIINNQTTN